MASSRWRRRRRAAAALASGLALTATGAGAAVAWRAGLWGTLLGAGLVAAWLVALGLRTALHHNSALAAVPADEGEEDAAPLRLLLDQVPLPLVRADAAGARAINRAARALFATDDRILPVPPALLDDASDRFRHAGRDWRVDRIATASGEQLAVLVDVAAAARDAEGRGAEEMVDILGHELLNGLSPIVSLADSAVTAAVRGDPQLPAMLATLARRVEGLEGFARGYRALSRLPAPVPAPIPLDDLTTDLARLFAARYGDDVALDAGVPPGQIVTVDRDQLTQALWALLQNGAEAALAAPAPPRVSISAAIDRDLLAIRVADTGGGVAAADRARVFLPFFTTKSGGSGIGLSLARRIARAHGGDLDLLPLSPTTFALRVPNAAAGSWHRPSSIYADPKHVVDPF